MPNTTDPVRQAPDEQGYWPIEWSADEEGKFGDIWRKASSLTYLAKVLGRPVVSTWNDTPMRAQPGQTISEVVQRFHAERAEIQTIKARLAHTDPEQVLSGLEQAIARARAHEEGQPGPAPDVDDEGIKPVRLRSEAFENAAPAAVATRLAHAALATGEGFVVDIDGVDMVAWPHQDAIDVVLKRWQDGREKVAQAEARERARQAVEALDQAGIKTQFLISQGEQRGVFTLVHSPERGVTWEREMTSGPGSEAVLAYGNDVGHLVQDFWNLLGQADRRVMFVWKSGKVTSGKPCSDCGTAYDECTRGCTSGRSVCCGSCRYSGTHGERVEHPEPPTDEEDDSSASSSA